MGDLISGKTLQDTHYILQEILSACLYKNTVPIVVGGGNDLSIAMIHALNFHQKNIRYTQINNKIDLSNEGEGITEQNFLQKTGFCWFFVAITEAEKEMLLPKILIQ